MHGGSDSRTLQVTPRSYQVDDVVAVLNTIYEACKDSPASFQQFKDVRDNILEELAVGPIVALARLEMAQKQQKRE